MIRTLLALACLALAGCSTFDADFKSLAPNPPPEPGFVAGAWDGTWESQKGFGSGRLQAVIARAPGKSAAGAMMASGVYTARFKATWSGILTAEYSVPLDAAADLTRLRTVTLHAEHDLGPGAGRYTMDGEATPTSFTAKYKADLDEGLIELHRPQAREK